MIRPDHYRVWDCLVCMATGAILIWLIIFGIHMARADELPWSLKVIVYDAVQGMVFTYGSKDKGPVLYKSQEECTEAIEGDEAVVKMRQKMTEIAHKDLGPQVLLRAVCLPVIAGEKLD